MATVRMRARVRLGQHNPIEPGSEFDSEPDRAARLARNGWAEYVRAVPEAPTLKGPEPACPAEPEAAPKRKRWRG